MYVLGSMNRVKPGDRFRYFGAFTKKYKDSVWEYVSDDNSICIQGLPKGETNLGWSYNPNFWEYIGNYSKSDKFLELYNILNED